MISSNSSSVPFAVELVDITKRFPGVVANNKIELSVPEGRIHAICGENGAGKSTLMKILYGMLPPDEGTINIRGTKVVLSSPADAISLGIGMVHQHFMLADHLTVLENVIIGAEPMKSLGRIDFSTGRDHCAELGRAYGLDIAPDDLVETLDVGQRQRVEIIKVLYRGASILILDEPTAVLIPQEVEELFRNIRELKAAGCTILFIDHKLDEVLEIADVITVLRKAHVVDTVTPDEVTAEHLAEMMIGSELSTRKANIPLYPSADKSTETSPTINQLDTQTAVRQFQADKSVEVSPTANENTSPVLRVENLSVFDSERNSRALLDDVSLSVDKKEIVGIAGVEGNGQTVLVDTILGLRPTTSGRIVLLDENVTGASVRYRREAGLGYIPQDRHREGLLHTAPLWENTTLGHQTESPCSRWRLLNPKGMRHRANEVCDDFDVRTPGSDTVAHALSGGNQQKLIVGRELTAEPAVLIAAHPTRGIDVGAQTSIWNKILKAKTQGLAILLVSADLEELIMLSDVIMVMLRGRFVARLDPTDLTSRDLGAYMTGACPPTTSAP